MRDYLDDRPIKLRRERSNTPASGRPFLLAVALCLLAGALIVLDQQGWTGPVRGSVQQVTAPLAQWLTGLRDGTVNLLSGLGSNSADQARIAELEQENGRLKSELLQIEQERVENIYLREQLQIQRDQPWQLLGAEVTIRSPDAGRRVITIARGSSNGVKPGMAVIGQSPGAPIALIGLVESVGPHSADVLLITDISSQISARVIHSLQTELGIVEGQWQRGSRLRLSLIDRNLTITSGDAVVTAGLTGALGIELDLAAVPANIPIGSVESTAVDNQQQIAELRPYVDPDQVRYAWVILNQDD